MRTRSDYQTMVSSIQNDMRVYSEETVQRASVLEGYMAGEVDEDRLENELDTTMDYAVLSQVIRKRLRIMGNALTGGGKTDEAELENGDILEGVDQMLEHEPTAQEIYTWGRMTDTYNMLQREIFETEIAFQDEYDEEFKTSFEVRYDNDPHFRANVNAAYEQAKED